MIFFPHFFNAVLKIHKAGVLLFQEFFLLLTLLMLGEILSMVISFEFTYGLFPHFFEFCTCVEVLNLFRSYFPKFTSGIEILFYEFFVSPYRLLLFFLFVNLGVVLVKSCLDIYASLFQLLFSQSFLYFLFFIKLLFIGDPTQFIYAGMYSEKLRAVSFVRSELWTEWFLGIETMVLAQIVID